MYFGGEKVAATQRWIFSILFLIGACIVSMALAFVSVPYFNFLNSFICAKGAITRALLFSSGLLIIEFIIIVFKPRFYGIQLGESLKRWPAILITTFGICSFTAIALFLTPSTPYSEANWFVEMVIVPLSEEAMWRGVIFSILLVLLRKLHDERTSLILAVIYSSFSFGLAHGGNMLVLPLQFVMMQVAYATIVGLALGYLRAKTKSIYPPMLLHAAFNLTAILF